MSQIKAKARVQIIVEVDADSLWGDECSIGQLYKQAADSARLILFDVLKPGEHARIRVIGEPKVVGVITEKD